MTDMKTYAFGPASGGTPRKIVLMLHGLGSNGQDLMGLAPLLAQHVPDALFLSPDAPQAYDMAPPGFGFQWFSLQSYEPEFMFDGATATLPSLNTYIDHVLADTGLKESDLVLLGFSQGTMMSLFAACRRSAPVAGVLGYSGALLETDSSAMAAMQKFPVCLIHGAADDVVPLARFHAAKTGLETAGYEVDSLIIPDLPHSIDESGIRHGAAFLQRVLS
jgi:phospholipase/carboxylesterase